MKSNHMKAVFACLFIFSVVAAGCGSKDKKAQLDEMKQQYAELGDKIKALEAEIALTDTTKREVKVSDILVTEIQPTLFRHFIDVQGIVDASQSVNMQPMMSGRVTKVLVKEGDAVKVGQVLAEMDYDIYAKQLNSLQPQLTLARDLYERQQRLWDQKIGSELQLLQAKTQVESLEKQMETLRENIEMHILKAPINGTIDFSSIKVGQLASAMSMEPAFRIVNLSGLKVKAEIAESYAAKVNVGNAVQIHFPDLNAMVDSKVSFVERMIDPMTRTFTAESALNGDNAMYHPNMIAVLKVIDYEKADALILPVNVVQTVNNESFVYVAVQENGQWIARERTLGLGNSYGGNMEVVSGLNPADKVITTGQLDVTDGSVVRF
ncbi:MAG: efflux RND transporter periplasmic adaptor subunit [Flavobacteriales bacterium]